MALRTDDISINTIIGKGSAISGNMKVNGFIRVDGDIDGSLETDGNVIVGENARIRGNLTAKSVIIGGIIKGNIKANESVKILAEAAVIGDIISRKVQVDGSAIIHGHCISIKDEAEFGKTSGEYLQSKAIKEKVNL
ncbi:protein CcmA, bactofilin family [Treponema bryantii]|jgi:cytoskeletal protein CcmA (bactofilin family)|uniref:Protein CcmA, bactofilin family n=1 Tax=Treponema bryantii TaxID=163 RepID=A0A1H9CPY4_9SPIR|nr:polymer-forming cytoskeletal protein [Treponema bryantii]BDC92345.1 cell shape determination protein CcmA [Treponema bryantii]SEQ03141.1 protein CcmA, bactofilin family [Treponema bryantii]